MPSGDSEIKLSAYLYTFNVDHYPIEACVKSCLGFADEVVVVDFGSRDGTREILNRLSRDPKVYIYEDRWDFEEPGMDGRAKAIARSRCRGEWVFQIDADEVVPERYWSRIRDAVALMERQGRRVADIGTVNFFLSLDRVCYHPNAGLFKTRLSLREPFSHGIPKEFRAVNRHGRTYCASPQSDGTDLLRADGSRATADISFADGEYNRSATLLEPPQVVRQRLLEALEREGTIYVYHYGSVDLKAKLRKATEYWMSTWEMLYGKEPIAFTDEGEKEELARAHYRDRIERSMSYTFVANIQHPKEIYEFYEKGDGIYEKEGQLSGKLLRQKSGRIWDIGMGVGADKAPRRR